MNPRVVGAGLVVILLTATFASASNVGVKPPPEGQKWVVHYVRFENQSEYPDYYFLVGPYALPNVTKHALTMPETAISGFDRKLDGDLYLLAIPKKLIKSDVQKFDPTWLTDSEHGVLKSNSLVKPIRTLPKDDANNRIITRYQISLGRRLRVEELGQERSPNPTPEWLPGGAKADPYESASAFGRVPWWLVLFGCGLVGSVAAGGLFIAVRLHVARKNRNPSGPKSMGKNRVST